MAPTFLVRPRNGSSLSDPDSPQSVGNSPRSVLDRSFSRRGLEEAVENCSQLQCELIVESRLQEDSLVVSPDDGRIARDSESERLAKPFQFDEDLGTTSSLSESRLAPAKVYLPKLDTQSRFGGMEGGHEPSDGHLSEGFMVAAAMERSCRRWSWSSRKKSRGSLSPVETHEARHVDSASVSGEVLSTTPTVVCRSWFRSGGRNRNGFRPHPAESEPAQPSWQESHSNGCNGGYVPPPAAKTTDMEAEEGGLEKSSPSVSLGAIESGEPGFRTANGMSEHGNEVGLYYIEEVRSEPKAAQSNKMNRSDHSQDDLEALVGNLRQGSTETRREAAMVIRGLARTSPEARVSLAQAGAIPPLMALMQATDTSTLENAALAMCNLAIGDSRNKVLMVKAGAIQRLANLLNFKHDRVREAAVAAILTLAAEEEHKAAIGGAGTIPLIADVLNTGTVQGRCDAAHALYNLLGSESNRAEVLSTQPVPGLLRVLKDSPASRGAEKAVAVIYTLTAVEEGRTALAEAPAAVLSLLAEIQEGSERGREVGVSALLAACNHSRKCRNQAMELGAVAVLLELSQNAPPRLRSKLRLLLKCLEKPGSAPVVMVSLSQGPVSNKPPKPSLTPESPQSPGSPKSPVSPSSYGSLHPLGGFSAEFSFNSGNNIVRGMVEESMRGAMKQIRLRANMPEC